MIEIRGTKIYRGPNVWARTPVIHISLDIGELENRPTNAIPGFYERLTELVPLKAYPPRLATLAHAGLVLLGACQRAAEVRARTSATPESDTVLV